MNLLFIEATRFTERIRQLRADPDLEELENLLGLDPEVGAIVQGTGGFRKIRMGLPGRGKRGGCRVIYLYVKAAARIYFVYLYPKNQDVDLSSDQKKTLKQFAHAIYEEVERDPSVN